MIEKLKAKLQILFGDVLGGANSAIVALPQALAFGVATGFGAGAGIWGAIILCFVAGILGTRIPLISGITGPATIVIASIMHALTGDISAVILIILMAGILQIILALTNLSSIVKYVPYPVISGFMNGVGVIIILMQINPLFGNKLMSNTIASVEQFFRGFSTINYDAMLIGLLTLFIVFLIPKRLNRFIPGQIIALIFCTFVSLHYHLDVEKIGAVSVALPAFRLPSANLHQIITYFQYAVTLMIVLSSETLLTQLVADSLTKTKSSPKRVLISQGIGNVCCGMTGSLPGVAATMRTVAAINAGAATRMAAIINPLLLLILLYKFSWFVAEIPLAVLAGILIKIGYDIIDVKFLKVIKFAPKDDLYVMATVFFLTVFYNLIVAVGAGMILAALLYAKKVADKAKLVQKSVYDSDIAKIEKALEKDYKHKIRVVHIAGQFFFGSATQLISQFDEFLGTKYLILDYNSDDLLDISAIFALEDIIVRLHSQHIKILLVADNDCVIKQLSEHGIIHQIGENRVFDDEISAINYAKECLKKKIKRNK